MDASPAIAGQVSGRIAEVEPVADILSRTWQGCAAAMTRAQNRLMV
jgi:hypothetical protein